MRTFDFSPLYRSTVGFDSVTRLLESALRADESQGSYPPYNIEKTGENAYRITMAVAGFSESDIAITAQDNSLVVTGKLAKTEEDKKFLHHGIAGRAFERRFELAEHIRVSGASLVNGLLHVELVKEVPEAKKPRTVKIETVAPKSATVLENQAA
ncbi:Hsp20 family protein [Hypericibacter sp.]|uniref:Hsp20 family protein n=1 Tax=Hypericibacter sp. TaxID=2705401 RepID=UPI003D6CDF1A